MIMSYFGAETLCEIGNCLNLFSRAPQMEFFFKKENRGKPKEKDKDRREGKGRRCYLGERIDSSHCRASTFHQVHFILFFKSSWCWRGKEINRFYPWLGIRL